MRKVFLFLLLVGISFKISAQQNSAKCGYTALRDGIIQRYGAEAWKEMQAEQNSFRSASKSTVTGHDTIPVIFHVILSAGQIKVLGSEAGINKLVDSQLSIINRDFNAMNKDSTLIPDAFKPLYGNAGVKFGRAHTDPNGAATPGYELITTTLPGFNLNGATGSKFGFSDAKYKSSGGADAWDYTTYFNVWLFYGLDNNKATNILGLTVPPSFTRGAYAIPVNELGVVLNYTGWIGSFHGRTLTHELGHYFELRHIWGDDDGDCPDNGGMDDGIADTPPQSRETYGCPAFPKYDACTKTGPGIMFMNFMDYTDDGCQHLFTKGQVERIQSNVGLNAPSYSLTQHPSVLQFPAANIDNEFIIYPNPAHGYINIYFTKTSSSLKGIRVVNTMGQVMAEEIPAQQKGFYSYSLPASGVYFVQLQFADKTEIRKIELQ